MALKVEILSLSGDTIRFLLWGADIALANALRRTMIAELPCMTIDDIFFLDNSSVLPDETLAHRLGLVPLTTDLDSYSTPDRCECKSELGCSRCRVVLTLDVKADAEPRTVYSGDLVSEDPKIRPASPNIELVKLAPGQSVKFEAYARLGVGKTHAKWQPVSMCVFQHVGDEEVVALRGGSSPSAPSKGGTCFLFTVESNGCLPPERIVSESARILIGKLDELAGKVKRGETADEVVEFEITEEVGRGLYSVGAGDFEEEEEGEGGQQE
jgi:DNA-directed RNA polymerase subunit D